MNPQSVHRAGKKNGETFAVIKKTRHTGRSEFFGHSDRQTIKWPGTNKAVS